MCGICGIYGFNDRSLLKRMCDDIAHRGPDDEGYYYDSCVMLGIRRLKVIDLSTGNQPIFNEDGSIVVVYNGEIYNFKENRKYLEAKGHKFYTQSDTETIVHLYEEFGDEFIGKLRGMFAFALWDAKKRRLLLVRDRLGIKPLFYYSGSGVLIFSSELKALLQYRGMKKEINFSALHDYLTYMYVPSPDTIFQGIFKLEPGNMMVCEDGKIATRRYWDLSENLNRSVDSFNDERAIIEKTYEPMKESVKMHLISDVPLGIFLSGGLDSGTIVAIASEFSSNPVKTFSIGFEDDDYNELDNVRLVADRFDTEHHEYTLGPVSLEDIENILYFFDEPFADSSAFPTYYVSYHARRNATVALSGDGGDELFGGYGNYIIDKIGMIYNKIPLVIKEELIPFIQKIIPDSSNNIYGKAKLKKFLNTAPMTPAHRHIFWLSCFSEDAKKELYTEKKLKQVLDIDSINKYSIFFDKRNMSDFINNCIYVDMKTVLPDDYLTKVDRMSMANSLEVRVPFLDHKMVEFVFSISSKYKIRGLTTKYLLRKIMKDKLPEKILKGKKRGFSIPLTRWLRQDFSILIKEFLSENDVKRRGYFNYSFIKSLSDNHLSGKIDNSKLLWILICFEIWHRRFMG
jgi:asparagine synthase (glutamine-hydrolysing)